MESKKGKYQQHQNALNKIKTYCQKKFPEIRFFNRHVGLFYSQRFFYSLRQAETFSDLKELLKSKGKYLVKINSKGMSDLYFIYPLKIGNLTIPVHGEIEIKTGDAIQNIDQVKWQNFCKGLGISYIVGKDPHQVYLDIKKIIDNYEINLWAKK